MKLRGEYLTIKDRIIWALFSSLNSYPRSMETRKLRSHVYGRRRPKQFWKYIDDLMDGGLVEMKPNRIFLTQKGIQTCKKQLRQWEEENKL